MPHELHRLLPYPAPEAQDRHPVLLGNALHADRFATAGDVLFTAARELRAHGCDAPSRRLLDRAIEWEQPRDTGEEPVRRLHFARMLYEAGRLDDSEALLPSGDAGPDGGDVLACRGAIAARRGDGPGARIVTEQLLSLPGRHRFGRHLLACARIAAVLGDATAAVGHLRAAVSRGCPYDVDLHADADLARIAHDPRFREMISPKG